MSELNNDQGEQNNNQNVNDQANNQNQNGDGKNVDQSKNTSGQQNNQTPTADQLHDAAIAATEAWQADPTKPELKTAAQEAVNKAKVALAAERKTVTDKEAANKPPAEYKLAKPEKSLLSDEAVKGIADYAKQHGLTQAQAQAQLDRESQVVSQVRQTVADEGLSKMVEQQESWLTTAKEDKEFGGADLPKNMELAKRVLTKYGTPEFSAILDDPKQGRFGNHPDLVRVLVRIGRAMSDDQLVISNVQGNTKPKSVADKLYGEGTVKGSGVQQ